MTKITKSALAAELGISRARISQYSNRGMPIRSDGQLDREQCLDWIKRNVDPTTSSKGLCAALETKSRGARQERDNPVDIGANLALSCLFSYIPNIAAELARDAGVAPDIVEKIRSLAHEKACAAGDEVSAEWLGLSPRDTWPPLEMCNRITTGD